jgi:myo-inositol-1-phosphate synthase
MLASDLDRMTIRRAPSSTLGFRQQVEHVMADIQAFKEEMPDALPVFINLLPAGPITKLEHCRSLNGLYDAVEPDIIPDLSYCLAAILSEIPVVNFTPNFIEIPCVINEAVKRGVPVAGRDGKTGQTYLKVVLASALKARNFTVDGWYSLNILGNEDGRNLMDPENAAGKVANKTQLLDDILGYSVGQKYAAPAHKVHIDYYPPRGDAKEAWDVIDFTGLFNLPMSIRINLQGRDSILAAPLILDLGRWLAALQMAGRSGPVPELGFYFKKPVGENPPLTFQEQVAKLKELERECNVKLGSGASG